MNRRNLLGGQKPRLLGVLVLAFLIVSFMVSNVEAAIENAMMPMSGGMMGGRTDGEKSPTVAALLALLPIPFDAGNLYASNWTRGILYTTLEIGLFVPGAVLLADNDWGDWGMHNGSYRRLDGYYTDGREEWTPAERNSFIALFTGFLVVKAISAYDAAYSVEKRQRQQLGLKSQPLSLHLEKNRTSIGLKAKVTW